MSSSLAPQEPTYLVKHTNVSSPSVIHREPSQQSITASEDYYSLSGSDRSANDRARSQHTITRFQTPPSRYRTPLQSRDFLPQQHAFDEAEEQQAFRKTPMRGEGRRRQSIGEGPSEPVAGASVTTPAPVQTREDGIRRKPVPSTVMEQSIEGSPRPISPQNARSSVAQRFSRETNAPTPDIDDRPFIEFALEQLTRDEEVRGSRTYPGLGSDLDSGRPYAPPVEYPRALIPSQQIMPSRQQYQQIPQEAPQDDDSEEYGEPPPKSPKRPVKPLIPDLAPELPPSPPEAQMRQQGPNLFIPVPTENARQPALRFLPGTLRFLPLGSFALLVLAYLACLIIAAVWSAIDTGLTSYGSFGDGLYFVFKYLPALVGMIIFVWLIQIQTAVYRIAPFAAMASTKTSCRAAGARLPLQPRGFVLPYFGHFRAGQPFVGIFMIISWLQLFTIPLLASSFNVHFSGPSTTGHWRWIAVQAAIWVVVGLYALLLIAILGLLLWLRWTTTGLKWDPRSLADMVVILERSNALDATGEEVGSAQLGFWRTTHRPNEIFQSYGIADRPARSYSVEDGRIREKTRYSDPNVDLEAAQPQPQRWSKEAMLPRSGSESQARHGGVLPWFLRPSLALLWPVISIVLLLAFLIVSYLPSTTVSKGFAPDVSAPVDSIGFSTTNFLYSFLPAFLAMLCLLFWLDIDMAYRRLEPFAALASSSPSSRSQIAERTLLPSYAADLPLLATLSALINDHLRVAWTSAIGLLSTAIPILASGIFWAQFSVPAQRTLIFAHMPGYYALTVFVTIYALAYLAIFPPHSLRAATEAGKLESFTDFRRMLRQSRLLDDVAFRDPQSKTVLVTRLLSGAAVVPAPRPDAAASKVSLADSVRGFGRARAAAPGAASAAGVPRYAYGRYQGRDGRDWIGIDRIGR